MAALVALYRPGPMAANMHNDYADRKNGRKAVEYFHPDAEELLADTYGLMIYQESVMRVAQKFAGYSLAEADSLRKAMGKKSREVMAKEKKAFVNGIESTGYDAALGKKLFDIIEQFADYAFNKSHSFGYGLIAYQTAYLKAHHPAEYLSALLTSVKANLDKAAVYLAECRTMGIEVIVPDVNRSASDFTPSIEAGPDGREIRRIVFGLSAVRNVGSGLVGLLLAEREANGPFVDFYDFCERVDFQVLNKKTLESLIKAGAFDSMGHPRQGLLRAFERIVDGTVARRRERDMGVMSLFGEVDEVGSGVRRAPAHPRRRVRQARPAVLREGDARPLRQRPPADRRRGVAAAQVRRHPRRPGRARRRRRSAPSAASSRDSSGSGPARATSWPCSCWRTSTAPIEVMVFPKTMTDHGHKLADDAVVVVKARVDAREDQPKLIAMDIEPFEPMSGEAFPLRVKVASSAAVGVADRRPEAAAGRAPGRLPGVPPPR